MTIQVIYLSPILLKEAAILNHENAIRTLELIRNKLLLDMDRLGSLNRDLANWDDSYEFMRNNNQDYLNRNLGNLTLKIICLTLWCF